jgi:hypothetical protein
MPLTYIPSVYPSGNETDGNFLYLSLGSFWTQIFQDKNVLRGYTMGMADELIQSYYRLLEVVRQYSIKDIDLFRKEKWSPLIIKKSEYNKTPFVFSKTGAVFGTQPNTDRFYANQIFRFGFPKQTDGSSVFSFAPKQKLGKFAAITNRIISPTLLLVPGTDVLLQDNTLYFNSDIFNNPYIPKAKVLGEFGKPATFVDNENHVKEDEFIILWVHNAQFDEDSLFTNFGALFDLHLPTTQGYKEILKALMNVAVEGPTITALRTAFAALVNTPVVIEAEETVEDIYTDTIYKYVITDKQVYKVNKEQELSEEIKLNAKLYAGQIIANNLKLIDSVIEAGWWNKQFQTNKLAFPSYVFAATTKNQLLFETGTQLVKYNGATLDFPVLGDKEDTHAFHSRLNSPSNLPELLKKLGFSTGVPAVLGINPVAFLFENLFKNNTLLLKLNFVSETEINNFFDLVPVLSGYLPAHVYLLVYMTLQLKTEDLANLNFGMTIPGFGFQKFSLDGSVNFTGARPGNPESDTEYYKDYKNRLFCISVGPYKDNQPLHADGTAKYNNVTNLVELVGDTSGVKNNSPGIKCGLMRTEIPESIPIPGEEGTRIPSTREIPTILLIDF